MAYATTAALATEAKSRREEDAKIRADATALALRVAALEAQMSNVILRITKIEGTVTPPVPPTPEPTPQTRPFAAPTTSGTVNVPGSIDATGATDVTSALTTFFGTVANGSTIAFPAGATYKTSARLFFDGRQNLIFEGNGARIHQVGTSYQPIIYLKLCSNIAVRNLIVEHDNPDAGTAVPFGAGGDDGHGISVRGSDHVEINGVTTRNNWGDGVYIEMWAPTWPSFVWVNGSVVDGCGRNGVTINTGRNVWITGNTIGRVQCSPIDLEPNDAASGEEHVRITGNTLGRYGYGTSYIGFAFSCVGADGALGNDIEFSGNTVHGGTEGYDGLARGINAIVMRSRLSNIRYLNNIATNSADAGGWPGGVLHFEHVDGLTVTGNHQSVSSGSLISTSDCTGAVTSPNP